MMLLLNVLRMYLLNIYQVYYIMYILNKVLLLHATNIIIIIIIEFAEPKPAKIAIK